MSECKIEEMQKWENMKLKNEREINKMGKSKNKKKKRCDVKNEKMKVWKDEKLEKVNIKN